MVRVMLFALMTLLLLPVRGRAEKVPSPYLLSVSFYTPTLDQWTGETVERLMSTPYDGTAAIVESAYAGGAPPTPRQFESALSAIARKKPQKHVWPWVFLNRIIGHTPSASHASVRDRPVEGKDFKGIDLEDKHGALSRFYATWRLALRLAKRLGAPGIVFDPECYSDYGCNQMSYVAQRAGISRREAAEAVRRIGARMADIVGEEFPQAVIFSLFSQFEREPAGEGMTPTLFDGMLRRAIEKNVPLTVVDGGETVGYGFVDLRQFQRQHNLRLAATAGVCQTYPGRLVLGGTLAPYADAKERTAWMTERANFKNSTLKTIADFEPLFIELMRRYRYVWIYGAGAAPYNPLNPEHGARYHPTLLKSLSEARKLGPLPAPIPKIDLANLTPMTDNLAADAVAWSVSGGPEAALEPLREGEMKGVRFRVNVDKKAGSNPQYPSGWLFLNRAFENPLDLTAARAVKLEIRFHQEGRLRFGLRAGSSPVENWHAVYPSEVGQWQTLVIPFVLVEPANRQEVAALMFYVAENWYEDGARLAFDFRDVRICK